jgi:hypothetical protein
MRGVKRKGSVTQKKTQTKSSLRDSQPPHHELDLFPELPDKEIGEGED